MNGLDQLPWREFVMFETRTAKLATVRSNGQPHVTPVGFVLDGDDVVFMTGMNSVKGKALLRGGMAALCVDEECAPFSFVIIEGTVSLSEDTDDLLTWATAVGGRYWGADRAAEFGRRNGVPGEMVVRVSPTKVVARLNGQPRQTLNLLTNPSNGTP